MSKRKSAKWLPIEVNGETYSLINFDHKAIESVVMDEMDTGFNVYYDTRWVLTTHFASWLAENATLVENRNVLIIGAGAGLETLLIAKHAKEIVINDLSEVSLNLCQQQLEENGLHNFRLLPGDYTKLAFPAGCDVAVACFSIYCPETSKAVESFLNRFEGEVIVVNEPLKAFRHFLTRTEREYTTLQEWDGGVALRFPELIDK